VPLWLAVIEQLPALNRTTSPACGLQTPVVVEVNVSGSDELALAAIGNGETPKLRFGMESNVIVWEAAPTVKVCGTGVAAA
jgi:hypothetical protein